MEKEKVLAEIDKLFDDLSKLNQEQSKKTKAEKKN